MSEKHNAVLYGIISLFQDDVTKDYSVSRHTSGKTRRCWTVSGASLTGAINKAYNEHKDDCE